MMVKGARRLGGDDIAYVSLVLRVSLMEKDFPEPGLLEQLVERLARVRRGFEGLL